MIPDNCLSKTFDLLHSEGGYLGARASARTKWWMHAIHVSREGNIASYVPPTKLRHPLLALLGFDGQMVDWDPEVHAQPVSKRAMVLSSWIMAFGVTAWALDRWVRGVFRRD